MSDANFQDVQNPYAAPYAEVGLKPEMAGPVVNFRGYAGFWLRFVAAIIDGVLMNIINLMVVFGGGAIIAASGNTDQPALVLIIQILSLVIQVSYYAGMESSSSQATLGKMALGLKVVDLQGRKISFGRALGRYFAKILSTIILFIGFIMVAFTERKQGLHDMIAGTLVIKTR